MGLLPRIRRWLIGLDQPAEILLECLAVGHLSYGEYFYPQWLKPDGQRELALDVLKGSEAKLDVFALSAAGNRSQRQCLLHVIPHADDGQVYKSF